MIDIRNYSWSQYRRKMKLKSEVRRHLNAYTSLLLYIQRNWNMLIPVEDNNALNKSMYYKNKDKVYLLDSNEEQNVEKDQKDLLDKKLDNKSVRNMLPKYTL